MKIFCFLTASLYLTFIHAQTGIIISHTAPIFSKKSIGSAILQWYRKGQKIFIHPMHFNSSTDYLESLTNSKKVEQNKLFFTTLDNNGKKAFISRKHVKLLFFDRRELLRPIKSSNHDVTDYTALGNYLDQVGNKPLETHRLSVSSGFALTDTFSYPYNTNFIRVKNTIPLNFYLTYAKKVSFQEINKVFFGGHSTMYIGKKTISGSQNLNAIESSTKIGVGPFISFDLITHMKFRLTTSGGPLFYFFDNYKIVSNLSNKNLASKHFTGRFNLTGQLLQMIAELNGIFHISFELFPSYTLKSSGADKETTPFLQKNIIKRPSHQRFIFSVGLQSSY
ncbi:hypothetical protein OAB57_03640 [Bacteriovoracaceae bacterium]|nr:hypothetical protein [Bacteriovoracaceae bacterium]